MPRLLLLRHAKAEPGSPAGDHQRPLSPRGNRDAAAVGKVIATRFPDVEAVLCSTSVRTRETWDQVGSSLPISREPLFLREIYEAGGDYLEILRGHGGTARSLLLIGHNPTIHATALALAPSPAGQAGTSLARKFPTAALAVLTIPGEWGSLQPGTAELEHLILPAEATEE